MKKIDGIIDENRRRQELIACRFNPVTGEGSIGERKRIVIPDFAIPVQWLPSSMMKVPLVRSIVRCGSVKAFAETINKDGVPIGQAMDKIAEMMVRIRMRHDFPFWAASFVFIKRKGGGEDIHFRLNRPQRTLIAMFEKMRLEGQPIRLVLLKARQWGGSTATQMYMAWLQLTHKVGLNSLIVGLQNAVADEINDMFRKMIDAYPLEMLYPMDKAIQEPKMEGVGKSGNIKRIPARNCKIKIGSTERPNSVRGGDYNLVHCSEVGLWTTTEGKTPEQMVRSACSGILLRPYTMIVYESTANGTGNFFQREYDAAKNGTSQFRSLFIAWFDIEQYSLPFDDDRHREDFAEWLLDNRDMEVAASNREEPGKYLWWLWQKGATLESINWYVQERRKYNDHGDMASEFPSDDVEAFVHSGARVFDRYKVEQLRPSCRPPRLVGDITARVTVEQVSSPNGANVSAHDLLRDIRFTPDTQGMLWIWAMPEPTRPDDDEIITDRYLAVVDIGGRSNKADWSVIVVFDRLYMMEGGHPSVVAQWYGHIDIDLLAWKAAQVAAFYDNALLVIESNTLETHDKERSVEGDQSQFILNQIKDIYPNLYARKQSEDDIRQGKPRKYGFHTNVATKPMVISTLVKVIREALYTERDERCIDEYITYERKKNGAYGAILGKHDDLLMTRAIGLHICFFEMDMPKIIKRQRSVPRHRDVVSAASF